MHEDNTEKTDLLTRISSQLSEGEKHIIQSDVQSASSKYFTASAVAEPVIEENLDSEMSVEWLIAALPIPAVLSAIFLNIYAVYAASLWAVFSAFLIIGWAHSRSKPSHSLL